MDCIPLMKLFFVEFDQFGRFGGNFWEKAEIVEKCSVGGVQFSVKSEAVASICRTRVFDERQK